MSKKLTNQEYKELRELVYNYSTKNEYGFNDEEQKKLLEQFPDVNMDKYNNALMGITCMMENDKFIIYHCDIFTALVCGIENRNQTITEWD
jgi:hypothetical protein